jgi:acyl-CoA reductase-like NAD-dependent aldehyde dehydrogenase
MDCSVCHRTIHPQFCIACTQWLEGTYDQTLVLRKILTLKQQQCQQLRHQYQSALQRETQSDSKSALIDQQNTDANRRLLHIKRLSELVEQRKAALIKRMITATTSGARQATIDMHAQSRIDCLSCYCAIGLMIWLDDLA